MGQEVNSSGSTGSSRSNSSGETSSSSCQGQDCYPDGVLTAVEAVTILLALGGFLGNGLTVLAILTTRLRNHIIRRLIGHLSLAGALYCCLVLPLQAAAYHHRRWVLPGWVCVGVAAVRIWLIGVNMCLLSAIAFYRFVHVVHPKESLRWSQGRVFYPVLVLCWTFPLFFALAPVTIGWGSYGFEPLILQCTFSSRFASKSHKITCVTIGFVIPCVFISVCYGRIGCVVYRSRQQLKTLWRRGQRGSQRLTAMMLLIFLGFFLGTTPYFIVNELDPNQTRPMAHIWSPCAAWLLYCLNPVIYTVMDRNFLQAYQRLVCCCCFFCKGGGGAVPASALVLSGGGGSITKKASWTSNVQSAQTTAENPEKVRLDLDDKALALPSGIALYDRAVVLPSDTTLEDTTAVEQDRDDIHPGTKTGASTWADVVEAENKDKPGEDNKEDTDKEDLELASVINFATASKYARQLVRFGSAHSIPALENRCREVRS